MTFSELMQNTQNKNNSVFSFIRKNRIIIIAILIIVIITGIVYQMYKAPNISNINLNTRVSSQEKDAVSEMEKLKDYSNALNSYALYVNNYPGDIYGYEGMIKILIFKNNTQFFDKILSKGSEYLTGSENSTLNFKVGEYYFDLSDFEKAKTYIEKSYELDKGNIQISLYYAKILIKEKEFEKARKVLDVRDDDSDEYIEAQIIKTYLWGTNFQNIEGQLTSLDTKIIENNSLKEQYSSLKNTLDTIDDRRAENIESAVLLAKEYCKFGYGEIGLFVLEVYEEDLKIYDDGLYYLLLSEYLVGQYSDVISLSFTYNENFGNNDSINLILARIYTIQNDIPNLEKYYEKVLSSSDGTIVSSATLEYCRVLIKNLQYSKAIMVLNNLDENGPDTLNIRKLYIEAYLGLENWEKAQFHISEALKITDLEVSDQLYLLSKDVLVSIKEGDWDIAQNKLVSLGNIDQTSIEYNYYKGVILFSTSKFSESVSYFEKAIEYDNEGVFTEKSKYYLNRM